MNSCEGRGVIDGEMDEKNKLREEWDKNAADEDDEEGDEGREGASEEDTKRVCEWVTLLDGSKDEGITSIREEVRTNGDNNVGEKDVEDDVTEEEEDGEDKEEEEDGEDEEGDDAEDKKEEDDGG